MSRTVLLPDDFSESRPVSPPAQESLCSRWVARPAEEPSVPGFSVSGYCDIYTTPIYDYGEPLATTGFVSEEFRSHLVVVRPGTYHFTFGTPAALLRASSDPFRVAIETDAYSSDPHWERFPYNAWSVQHNGQASCTMDLGLGQEIRLFTSGGWDIDDDPVWKGWLAFSAELIEEELGLAHETTPGG